MGYFASECSKSFGYVRNRSSTGFMGLAEVALGRVHEIYRDDSSLRRPPSGYDSVVACGRTEPGADGDLRLEMAGREVTMPRGAPTVTQFASSAFSQSEYLVYD